MGFSIRVSCFEGAGTEHKANHPLFTVSVSWQFFVHPRTISNKVAAWMLYLYLSLRVNLWVVPKPCKVLPKTLQCSHWGEVAASARACRQWGEKLCALHADCYFQKARLPSLWCWGCWAAPINGTQKRHSSIVGTTRAAQSISSLREGCRLVFSYYISFQVFAINPGICCM